jgi:hypothetical protein
MVLKDVLPPGWPEVKLRKANAVHVKLFQQVRSNSKLNHKNVL